MLSFKTDSPLPPHLAEQARMTGRVVHLRAHDAVEVEDLLVELRRAGCHIEDLEIGRADLEDVFLEIMQADTAPGAFVADPMPSGRVQA